MARVSSLLSFAFTLLIFLHGYTAQQFPNECQLDQLNAIEPSHVLKAEAGRIEVWDHHAPQLRCSGVSFVRYVIESKGLYLPSFLNTAKLSFVAKGRGLMGRVIPGCAETFQDSSVFQPGQQGQGQQGRGQQGRGQQGQGQEQEQEQGPEQRQSFSDMHQKVEHIRSGDTIATPSGVAQWFYNDGNQPLVIVSVLDLANHQNQLDRNPRPFYLAGNNPQGQAWLKGREQQPQNNIFNGFPPEVIAKAFKINVQTAQQLQNQEDNRGNIVFVKGEFGVIRPPLRGQRPQEEEAVGNGLEETICSARSTDNLDDPSNADVYKPQLGYISTLNSYDLPILRFLRLSALRGSIRQNAMVLPQWNANANAILYVTDGEAQVQVVNDNGERVFDGQVSQGQLLAIPQGFAVMKRATSDQFRWVEFKTNANAQINTLAGRISIMAGLPLEVISNGYQISPQEARKVKFNTLETTLTHASGPASYGRPRKA
ncbi:cruciferin BnC1 isoform X2 [Eutrema salsugineum]|uniref:cruciferin BnC1 isoform X2 n=1 Tax=Eutrema salsugineum TaxID=72664 RepID=UPI000CECF414|nr:cruciferin BnC1 isoform X2 [Eutrema salsugineum]